MGIVKNGAVSGVLPSTGAFAVHYPGYPSSTSRALETLGGTEVIAKARCLQSNKLELRFRPEDPYSHPAFGEIQPCNSLLLKISKRNSNKGQIVEASKNTSKSPPTSDDVQIDLAVDIVARVLEGYHFNGMADYQHVLAIRADTARRKKRHWTDMKPHFEKGSLMDVDQEDLMILLPPLFSPKDIPEKVVLRPSTASKSKKTPGVAEERWELDAEPSYFIDFNTEKIPEIVDWEKYVPQGSDQWEWQMFMSKLFEEKPIWHKESIGERFLDNGFVVGNNMLKRLLFRAAYYFSNGPFLRFWVRKGYDPRKDPGSRIYQRTDFRVPPLLRSYCDANAGNELKQKWKDICAFRVFPFKCHTLLQFVELADEYIQQEIREPPQLVTCSRASGWFSDHMLENLRLRVAVRFLSVYPKPGAEFVLKSASKNFEKSKRMRIWRLESKVDDYGQQQVIKETSHHDGDKEPNALEEEEEDDSEAENDEEFDAYDALPGGGEDGDFSLEQCSYLNEGNVSRNYLQDLFGSFPYTAEAGGDQLGHATACDEEYQIYEHYSDDNYSEDDQY